MTDIKMQIKVTVWFKEKSYFVQSCVNWVFLFQKNAKNAKNLCSFSKISFENIMPKNSFLDFFPLYGHNL